MSSFCGYQAFRAVPRRTQNRETAKTAPRPSSRFRDIRTPLYYTEITNRRELRRYSLLGVRRLQRNTGRGGERWRTKGLLRPPKPRWLLPKSRGTETMWLIRHVRVGLACVATACVLTGGCYSINPDLIDYDGDGVPDVADAFPANPDEHTDRDGDGVGDNADAFPDDPARSEPADETDSGDAGDEADTGDDGDDTDAGGDGDDTADGTDEADDGKSGGRR